MNIYYVDYPVKNKRYTRKMQHNIERKLAREQRKIDRYFMEHYWPPPPDSGFIMEVNDLLAEVFHEMIKVARIPYE